LVRWISQFLIAALFATTGCGQQAPTAADFAAQRQRMVDRQLKFRGIKDERVLAGFHFRNSDQEGTNVGRDVARYVAENYFQPLQ
jgi:hypothetical protein